MTISAGATLVAGCTIFLAAPGNAFVAPAILPRNQHLAPSPRTAGATAAVTTATKTAMARLGEGATAPLGATARARRRRSRMPSRLPDSSSSSGPGAGPLLMSSTGEDDGDGGGEKSSEEQKGSDDGNGEAAPVDAELAEPPSGGGGGGGGVGDLLPEMGDPATRAALKQKLLRKVATLNRGFLAQEADRLDVEEIVEMLEMENPNSKPCKAFASGSSPLAGRWQLLYTTSLDVLSLQVNPTVTVGKIFQEIESDGRAIQNIIELQPPFAAVNKILGSSMATLTVKLETEPVSDSRINLKFVRTEIKADSLFGRKLDLPTLGVDLPSAEKLENILPKGGGGGGDLKGKLEDAKSKAQAVARKAEDKRKNAKKAVEEKVKGGSADSSGEASEGGSAENSVVDAEAVAAEEGEKGDKEEEESEGEQGEDKEETSSSDGGGGGGGGKDGDEQAASSPSSAASLLRKPYFESTYCDEDLRVGRTGNGDMFVSVRA